MNEIKKRKSIIIGGCIAAGICLTGIAALVIFLSGRNPLTKGLIELSNEVSARKEEMGEYFWIDAINQIGSENMQAEYSVNIGGIPELQNITVGLDGTVRRDMERELFGSEIDLSVANAQIAEASFFGTADTVYFQIPSVWDGSIVLNAEDISGQWNASAVRAGLERLMGQEFDMNRRLDIRLFDKYYVNKTGADELFEKSSEAWRALYKNMEVIKVERAKKKGLLEDEQAESLESYMLEDGDGEQIMTTCYLVLLPEEELKEIFADIADDIRLCVYLSGDKRIVRICTVPGEALKTDIWEGGFSVNMTGAEASIDRIEMDIAGTADMTAILSSLFEGEIFSVMGDGLQEFAALFAGAEIKGNMIIEKNRETRGSYQVRCDASLEDDKGNKREFSLESGIQGEQLEKGAKLSLEVERLVIKSREQVICRGSGRTEFMPLAEEVEIPVGKENRIGEMNQLETTIFLGDCLKNVYKNFAGYLKILG